MWSHKGSKHSAPAAYLEAITMCISFGGMSGPLIACRMASNSAATVAETQNKAPMYVLEATDIRGFLTLLRALCETELWSQIKGVTSCLSH